MPPVYLKVRSRHKRSPPISTDARHARQCRANPAHFAGLALLLVGCGTGGSVPAADPPEAHPRVSERTPNIRPAAIIDGIEIPWSALQGRLGEACGAQALDEAVLDGGLERELAARGWSVGPEDLERERALLHEALARDAELDPAAMREALARLRRTRGLGPAGFSALLRRNATLRKLVGDEVLVEAAQIERAATILAAPRVVARVIVLASEREASDVRAGLLGEPDDLPNRVARMAVARSLDASARDGGRVGPVSVLADSVPQALRTTLASLPPGELSGVTAVDEGYALVLVESRAEAREATPQDRARAERDARARAERVAMDRLARRLIDQARVTVLDESLAWSWANRRAPAGEP